MKLSKHFVVLILIPCILVSSIRAGYYLLNYANIQSYNETLKSSNIFKNENFSSTDAIRILRSSNQTDGVITFRQADIIHSIENPWLDNFDPRFAEFLEIDSVALLHAALLKKGYKYVHVPPYTWPTIYKTTFQKLLSSPKYSVPLVSNVGSYSGVIDKAQLFKLNSKVEEFPKGAICAVENPRNFKNLVGQNGAGKRVLSILSGIPMPETISEVNSSSTVSSPLGYWFGASKYIQLDRGRDFYFPRYSNQLLKNFKRFSVELVVQGKGLIFVDASGFPSEVKTRNMLLSNVDVSRVAERKLDSIDDEVLAFQFQVQNQVESVRFRVSSYDKDSFFQVLNFRICGYEELFRQSEISTSNKLNSTVKSLLQDSGLNCPVGENSCRIETTLQQSKGSYSNQKRKNLTLICNSIRALEIDRAYNLLCKTQVTIPPEYLSLTKIQCFGNCLDQTYTLHGVDPSGVLRILPIVFEGSRNISSGMNFLPSGKWTGISVRTVNEEFNDKLLTKKSIRVTEVTTNDR